jgi:hypothetical protein
MPTSEEEQPDQETEPKRQNARLSDLLRTDWRFRIVVRIERMERVDDPVGESGWRLVHEE